MEIEREPSSAAVVPPQPEATTSWARLRNWIIQHPTVSLSVTVFIVLIFCGFIKAEETFVLLNIEHVPKSLDEDGLSTTALSQQIEGYLNNKMSRSSGERENEIDLDLVNSYHLIKKDELQLPDISVPFTGLSLQRLIDLLRYVVRNDPTTVTVNVAFAKRPSGYSISSQLSQDMPILISYRIVYSVPRYCKLWHAPGAHPFEGTVRGNGSEDAVEIIAWLLRAAVMAREAEIKPDKQDNALKSGEAFLRAGQYNDALNIFKQKQLSDNGHAALQLARMTQREDAKSWDEAKGYFKKAIDAKADADAADRVYAFDELGILLQYKEKNLEGAERNYKQAIEEEEEEQHRVAKSPILSGAHYHLGSLYFNTDLVQPKSESLLKAKRQFEDEIESADKVLDEANRPRDSNDPHDPQINMLSAAAGNAERFRALSELRLGSVIYEMNDQLSPTRIKANPVLSPSDVQIVKQIRTHYENAVKGLSVLQDDAKLAEANCRLAWIFTLQEDELDNAIQFYNKSVSFCWRRREQALTNWQESTLTKWQELALTEWRELANTGTPPHPQRQTLAMEYKKWGDFQHSKGQIDKAAEEHCQAFTLDPLDIGASYKDLCRSRAIAPGPKLPLIKSLPETRIRYAVELKLEHVFGSTLGVLSIDPHGFRFSEMKSGKNSFEGSWSGIVGLRKDNRSGSAELSFKYNGRGYHFQVSPTNLGFFEQTFYPAISRWLDGQSR